MFDKVHDGSLRNLLWHFANSMNVVFMNWNSSHKNGKQSYYWTDLVFGDVRVVRRLSPKDGRVRNLKGR